MLFEAVRQKEVELRKLSRLRAELQEDSLRAMSRELHDGFGQVLTVINMDLGLVERNLERGPAAMRTPLRDARDQLTALLQGVRTMSQVLRPPMLDFGLVPTLHWFVEKFIERTQIAVALRTPPEETRLPAPIELLLYRVAQEALTNVAKHARAHHVDVELAVLDGQAFLCVADDGVGASGGSPSSPGSASSACASAWPTIAAASTSAPDRRPARASRSPSRWARPRATAAASPDAHRPTKIWVKNISPVALRATPTPVRS